MNKQRNQLASAVLVALVLATSIATPQQSAIAEEIQATIDSDPAQFARGAQTWADTCARCHNMRDPNELRADQWRAAVAHMRVRSGLTGAEARDVLAFLQGQTGGQVAAVSSPTAPAPAVGNGGNDVLGSGEGIYAQTCIACHGTNGKGAIPGVTDFTDEEGPLSKTDVELSKSISEGFQSSGSFMAMPPKGGNPALTTENIKAVLAYLRREFGK